jgi:hypothetical protein
MKHIILMLLVTAFSQAALSAPGFEHGSSYNTVKITGKIHVTCDYDNGSGWADHDCEREVLQPTYATRFRADGPTQATRLDLSVRHEDGAVVDVEASMNTRTGYSDSDFNLWNGTGRYDQAILAAGSNIVKYKLTLSNGRIEREGEFLVNVDTSSAGEHTCQPGRMASENARDCRSNPPRYLCDQYFRYENYCGATR